MTIYDQVAIFLLMLTIIVNCLTVYFQKTRRIYDRFGRHSLTVHSIIVSIFWGLFIISEFVTSKSDWRLENSYPVIGYSIMAIALTIFVLAVREIGYKALSNGNFFGQPIRQLRGIYKYVPEPIYISYSLWFLGIGLVSSLKVFFVFTVISLIGLVLIESRFERPLVISISK